MFTEEVGGAVSETGCSFSHTFDFRETFPDVGGVFDLLHKEWDMRVKPCG